MPDDPAQQRADKLAHFDPDTNGHFNQGLFGLPFEPAEASLVMLPVPWDATVSYGEGAAHGPYAIWKASQQLDLYDDYRPGLWRKGYAMAPIFRQWQQNSEQCRQQVRGFLAGDDATSAHAIDEACEHLNQQVKEQVQAYLRQHKHVGLVGGEHSVILGCLRALKAHQGAPVAVLQLDAHADLRAAYEGLTYSHASIMYNAVEEGLVNKLVPVGLRDYAEKEASYIRNNPGTISPYTDQALKKGQLEGKNWQALCDAIISELPLQVYVSVDVDGLDPALCPNTGTPVPGGLGFEEAMYLLHRLTERGRQIIGFDLCEVAPGASSTDEWDGNVGARILYHLCNETVYSNQTSREAP